MKIVASCLLLVCTSLAIAQTVTDVTFLNQIRDQHSAQARDVILAIGLKNDQHVPITVTNGQFVLVDNQENIYESSDNPFPMESILVSGFTALPQRVNPVSRLTPCSCLLCLRV
jgi:hypothetical protein